MFKDEIKKIALFSAVLLAAAAVLIFRKDISETLSFGSGEKTAETVETFFSPLPSPSPEAAFSGDVLPSPSAPSPTPSYRGRDAEEIRPTPEEVRLFSAEQKDKIYGDIKTYGKAVKENPDFFFGWLQVGLLKKVIGDYEGARDAWEYVSLLRPQNSLSFANLGELYWKYLPDYRLAEKNFRIAIKNKPDDSGAYVSLSELYRYSYKEKADSADDVLLEGIVQNPKDVFLLKSLAALYEMEKKYADAARWWRKVLDLSPDDAAVKEKLENLEKIQ